METGVEEVTWRELIDACIDARLIDLHTSLPAKVERYDASKQVVDVTLMINKFVPDGALPPNYVSEPLPKLADVPVAFQRCKQFTMTFPLVAGDTGFVLFSERNFAAWRATGNQSDPGDVGLHTLSGAVFLPGVYPDGSAAHTADNSNMVIGSDTDGNSRIEVKPTGGINLGAGASKGVARVNDPVGDGTIAFAFVPGSGGASLAITYTPGNGGPVQSIPSGTGVLNIREQITFASNHVNAVD